VALAAFPTRAAALVAMKEAAIVTVVNATSPAAAIAANLVVTTAAPVAEVLAGATQFIM